jgi:hypothetical protein
MNKKEIFAKIWILGIIGFFFSIKPVLAAYSPSDYMNIVIESIQSNFGPFFAALLGVDSFDAFLFAKILVFFLLFSVVFIALKNIKIFEDNRAALFVVSLATSLLSVRYLVTEGLFKDVLLPYGVLGVSLTVLIPFLVFFLFVENSIQSTYFRRAAWILYGIVFFFLWIMRLNDPESSSIMNWIYGVGLACIAGAFIFDAQVNKFLQLRNLDKNLIDSRRTARIHISEEINRINKLLADGAISQYEFNSQKKALLKRYKRLI